jgi:hypothetical protein
MKIRLATPQIKCILCEANPGRKHSDCYRQSSGFTLLELLSIIVVSTMFSGLVIYFTFNYWRMTATLSNDLETYVGRLTAGDRLREAFNASSGLIIQNSLADSHTGDPDLTIPSGNYWRPLHAVPGSVPIGVAGTTTPVLYFKSPSIDSSKDYIMNGSLPYEDEFVLYMDGTTKQLRLRSLANPSAAGNRIVTTCPAGSDSTSCPLDRLIVDNISSVGLRYFSRSGNLMDYTSIIDPSTGNYIGPDMPAVEVVELVLYVFKKATVHGGADTISQTIIRVALRNT